MRTRDELDAEWRRLEKCMRDGHCGGFATAVEKLLAAERAYVDREAQARAIRFAADSAFPSKDDGEMFAHWIALQRWADRVEAGDIEVPR
jgi:hypothetical protein